MVQRQHVKRDRLKGASNLIPTSFPRYGAFVRTVALPDHETQGKIHRDRYATIAQTLGGMPSLTTVKTSNRLAELVSTSVRPGTLVRLVLKDIPTLDSCDFDSLIRICESVIDITLTFGSNIVLDRPRLIAVIASRT